MTKYRIKDHHTIDADGRICEQFFTVEKCLSDSSTWEVMEHWCDGFYSGKSTRFYKLSEAENFVKAEKDRECRNRNWTESVVKIYE